MTSLEEIRKNRIKKIKKIREWGRDPYPASVKRTHTAGEAVSNFERLSEEEKEIFLTGRIMSFRGHGGVVFSDIKDGTGKIQIAFKKDALGEKKFELLKEVIDVGDFLEVSGNLFKTKKGEKTLKVSDFNLISKAISPLPEKWHGLKDIEERYRKRYLDLLFNEEVRGKIKTRAKIISATREFLENKGFMEVETPILQSIYGGARAKPFKTRLNALDMEMFLRISPELYLKRLLIGGFEKVYEIGRCFRNEGMDKDHNPDFTMLEFYWAFADYKDLMKLTEEMFSFLLKKVFSSSEIKAGNKKISFSPPFERIEFEELLHKYTKINLSEINQGALRESAKKIGVEVEIDRPKAEIADEIYKKYCRPKIWRPTFVIHHPKGFQPLAKSSPKDEGKLLTFQLIAGGVELNNAFSELNDPREQKKRFAEQENLFKKGFSEAQRKDEDFIKALEIGMPPAAGFGMGMDRLAALLTDSRSLREIILFPAMRRKE